MEAKNSTKKKSKMKADILSMIFGIGGVVILILVAVWIGIITHRPAYQATGTIALSPPNNLSKGYLLKVGDPSKEVTDTMTVTPVASHWYSLTSHDKYSIRTATWSNGETVTLHDSVYDHVHHQLYVSPSDCSVPSMNTGATCFSDKGTEYYVRVLSVGSKVGAN
jgi:hypothetical protein